MQPVKVFLCGGSGSGKTVMLSSLFKSLSIRDSRLNMRCQTSATAAGLLRFIYSNLSKKWPEGTELDALHEIPFDFYVDNGKRQSYHAASVMFYDYAGRAVDPDEFTTAVAERVEAIKTIIDDCNVVICVLDGSLVYESLYENGGEPIPELERMINATLGLWLDSNSRDKDGRKNHYFVITKWDLFKDTDETLVEVKNFLLGIEDVETYLDNHVHNDAIVRIIPVSAVGSGFAHRVPGTRDMEIIGKKPSSPINIDVPLAALIPDLVNAKLEREAQQLNDEAWRISQEKLPWWNKVLGFIGSAVKYSPEIRKFLSDLGLNPYHINRISEMLKAPGIVTEQERQDKLADIVAKAESNEDAAAIVHNHFGDLTRIFDEKYPSSHVK